MTLAGRESRLPPFRTERGRVGHPSVISNLEWRLEWTGRLPIARNHQPTVIRKYLGSVQYLQSGFQGISEALGLGH
jgi:hypothetical protein